MRLTEREKRFAIIGFTIGLLISFFFFPSPADASEIQCPDPARPIHYAPLCLSEAEFAALTAPPPPSVAPTPVFVDLVERWRPIATHFWLKHGQWVVDRMMRILRCESGGNPWAYNSITGVKGLWQIHPLWQKKWPGDYYDPWTNGAVAYQVWLEQGWGAWACKG